jgi:hypothetical protein
MDKIELKKWIDLNGGNEWNCTGDMEKENYT